MEKQKRELNYIVEVDASKFPKRTKVPKESMGRKIITEALTTEAKYMKIPYEKIKKHYKTPIAGARGLGRIIKSMNLEEKLTVFEHEGDIYLERKEEKKK